MISDTLSNAPFYCNLHKSFRLAFDYLQQTDFSNIENGKIELDGENVFAIVNRYNTHSAEELKWEAHRKYIDVQFIASGNEHVGIVDIGEMSSSSEYDDGKDVQFFEGAGEHFHLREKMFAVIFPHEVHKPGITSAERAHVLKVVIKVRL